MPRGVAPVVAEAGPTTTPQELDKTDDNAMRDPPLCLGNDDVLSHVMQATSHNDPSVWCLFGAADADQTPRSERSGEKCSIDNHTLWSQRDDVESVMRVAGEAWDYHDWNARVKGIGVHSLYIPNVKRDVVREYAWQDAACAILQACLPAKLCHVTVNLVRRSMPKTAGQFDATEFADFVGNELRNRVDKLLVDMAGRVFLELREDGRLPQVGPEQGALDALVGVVCNTVAQRLEWRAGKAPQYFQAPVRKALRARLANADARQQRAAPAEVRVLSDVEVPHPSALARQWGVQTAPASNGGRGLNFTEAQKKAASKVMKNWEGAPWPQNNRKDEGRLNEFCVATGTCGTRAWNLGRAVYSKDQGLREDRVAFEASRRASQGAGGSGEENASGQENVPPRAPVPT